MKSCDLGCVDKRLWLRVDGREDAKSHGESIRYPVGEAVERIVVVIGRVSVGCDGRGGDTGRHGSQW